MKIGAYVPVWNAEKFIKPHLEMLSSLDRILVGIQQAPLTDYKAEHHYPDEKDRTEEIVNRFFPTIETFQAGYSGTFGAGLFNEGFSRMKDCDIVFKLDPDYFFTKRDWDTLVQFIRNNSFDCYKLNYAKCSVNYNVIGEYDYGTKDAKEFDPIAVNPSKPFEPILAYQSDNPYTIEWDDFMLHHFRGWKVTVHREKLIGPFVACPDEIKDKMVAWQKELGTI